MNKVVNMPGAVAEAPMGLDPAIQSSIVLKGDLSGLNESQKKEYYLYRCRQVGLDPAAKPFDLLTLNGKQVLYANASATQQLCSLHRLSTQITHREKVDDIYIVSVRVTGADGRVSENQGAVSVGNARGDALANAILKATTKAIRRSVLSHCGLGMLDETEVESIPQAQTHHIEPVQVQPIEIIEEPKTGIPLMIPGATEAYSYHANVEEWVDAYLTMVDKISDSKKFNAGDKLLKLSDLEKCNLETVGRVRDEAPALYQVFGNGIAQARLRANEESKKS
jgi:hypothetical protein